MIPDIPLKTSDEVAHIHKSCRIAAAVLRSTGSHVQEGVSTRALDRIAAGLMRHYGAESGVAPGFPGSICTSVNEVAAHGVPTGLTLRRGDIITIDVAVLHNGWHGDAAATFAVGEVSPLRARLVEAAGQALIAAVRAVRAGVRIGDVGAAVQAVSEENGFVVLSEFHGHGIGRKLHEEPAVPHTGTEGVGLPIVPGMVFTVEPALSPGSEKVVKGKDGWSLHSADGSVVAQFEHTVAVFAGRTEVLTVADGDLTESFQVFR